MRLQLLSLRKLAALFLVSRLLEALRYPSEFRRQSDIVTSGLLMRRAARDHRYLWSEKDRG